ncbi:MAG: DUF1127 domain-containing protein [Boseongicola sp.]|nr:DUF1127 domain-containing protein [Boseongicola sp.]NNJ67890.1 DUF1127 domain-containing protein [Boseongicola sp.]
MTDATCTLPVSQNSGHPLLDLSNKLAARVRARQQRKDLRSLKDLDTHTLQDIGLTREDVTQTLAQPLSVDAHTELHRIAHLRSRTHM